jgi:hypothetical protein
LAGGGVFLEFVEGKTMAALEARARRGEGEMAPGMTASRG